MDNTMTMSISIPSDDQGYILLQCEYCGSFFKIPTECFEDDSILNISCPSCGLISDNYLTKEVLDLAQAKIHNYAMDLIHQTLKDMERKSKKSSIHIKASSRYDKDDEAPIKTKIDTLLIAKFKCCNKTAKVSPLIKYAGCYCAYCGVIDFEVE